MILYNYNLVVGEVGKFVFLYEEDEKKEMDLINI